MTVATSEESERRKVSIVLDVALEDRLHRLRGSGRGIRSLSAVARAALDKGLEVLEREASASSLEASS